MRPSADAGAPRVDVSRLGNRAVGTSWPASARKLAAPMPVTPGVSQDPACSSVLATRPVWPGSTRGPRPHGGPWVGHPRARHTFLTRDVYLRCMSRVRTNIEIEDTYVQAIMDRYGVRTKTDAVELALRHLAGQPLTRDQALAMRGAHAIAEPPADAPPRGSV